MAPRRRAGWAAGVAIAGFCIALVSALSMIVAGYLLDEQRIPPVSLVPLFASLGAGVVMIVTGGTVLVAELLRRGP